MIPAVIMMAWAQSDATEFFPAPQGAKWRYRLEAEAVAMNKTEEVVEPVKLADELPAIHFRTFRNGRVAGHTYFRVDGDTVYLMGTSPTRLIDPPRIVFKVGVKKQTWSWKGLEEGLPLSMTGESDLAGEKDVLGQKRKTLKVRVNATYGEEPMRWAIKQEAIYAAGVGLVEMTEERSTKKTRERSVTRLESFTFPEGLKS